ncbi:unnamed protein product [Acanthoscelides obtectus]|uniref:Uncharacterized protein n=1 Tax=Acanthoscelides obtectus TaxID=200917 RepID=A0A9P0P7W4_ACAOB|nr:unnamed protein product [Acanthoscelides obtectus]CAK1666714.1 hypothetical protein AOBTE_LOCUS25447 [Acanthoscelides obtectus]
MKAAVEVLGGAKFRATARKYDIGKQTLSNDLKKGIWMPLLKTLLIHLILKLRLCLPIKKRLAYRII